jgi:tetratricopeptide (TPR) repeat protein
MDGNFQQALELYQRSIELLPSAEAYTFMGWTYSFMGKLDEAIRHCLKAIDADPDFGNPYNDIGAYLIELGRVDEAIQWLLKATRASRYECHHYPWYNLGRIHEDRRQWDEAKRAYAKSIEACPEYCLARNAFFRLISRTN